MIVSSILRRYRSVLHLSNSLFMHNVIGPRSVRAICNSTQEYDSTRAASEICRLLRGNGSWDRLNSSCGSLEVSDHVVEEVLIDLKSPVHAKKALLFFHWSSRERKHHHSVRSYCLMVHILVRAGWFADARSLLESAIRMVSDSEGSETILDILMGTYEIVLPGSGVYDLLVVVLSKLRSFEAAFEVLRYLGGRGVSLSLTSFNSLLRSVERSDQFDMAWEIFEHMVVKRKYPNRATIEIMVGALCKGGALQEIIGILGKIRRKACPPSVVVSTALVLRIIESGRPEEVLVLLTRMLQKNMIFDDVAHSLFVYAHYKMGNIETTYSSFDEMLKRGLDANPFVYTTLIRINCTQGRIEEAYCMLNEMISAGLDPYDATYNELIIWSCRMDKLEKSLTFYDKMLSRGFLPSLPACHAIISKLCDNGEVKKANNMLTTLLDKGYVPDEAVYSNLINGYGKIRCHQEVWKLYYEMKGKGPSPGSMTYTALVKSLYQCGQLKEAEEFANIMKHKLLASPEQVDALLKCK